MDPMGIGSISTIPASLGRSSVQYVKHAARALAEGGAGHLGKWSPEMTLRLPIGHRSDIWGAAAGEPGFQWWKISVTMVVKLNMCQSESWSTDLDELGGPYFRKPPCGCSFLWFVVCFSPCCHRYMTLDPSSMWCSSSPAVIYEIKACPGTLGPRSHYASCIVAGWFGVPKWILLRQGVARDLKQFISVSMFFAMPGEDKVW